MFARLQALKAEVRRSVPSHRLVEWTASDGWRPLCQALSLPVSAEPFPHANSTENFLARIEAMAKANAES